MNALLGTEVPRTTSTTQTSVPQAFVDPQTELVKLSPNATAVPMNGTAPDGTQLWRITHNGVDAHAIHFHLFHLQLINRVGWDGAVYPPDADELGWKDTIRMSPLEDVIVALRPMAMTALPFKVANLHRPLIPQDRVNTVPADFFNWSPVDGGISSVSNQNVNFGWEYLWHCHILGHEENDMMRVISAAQSPEDPVGFTVTQTLPALPAAQIPTSIGLSWLDNSVVANWVTIQYSDNPNFTGTTDHTVSTLVRIPECGVQTGCQRYFRYTGTTTNGSGILATTPPRTVGRTTIPGVLGLRNTITKYWRIQSHNTVGAGPGIQDIAPLQVATATAGVGNAATPPTYTQCLSTANNLHISCPGANGTPGAGAQPAKPYPTLLSTTSPTVSTTVAAGQLLPPDTTNGGTGGNAGFDGYANITADSNWTTATAPNTPNAVLDTTTLTFPSTAVGSVSAPQTVTLTNTGSGPLTITSIAASTPYAISSKTCGASLVAGASCQVNVTLNPVTAPVNPSVTGLLTYTVTGGAKTVSLVGTVLAGPPAPSPVTLFRNSINAATLSWTDQSINETSFQPQTSTNGGSTWSNVGGAFTVADPTTTGGLFTTNIAVDDTTNALFRVVVFANAVSSNSVSVSLNDTVAPLAPTGLTGSKATGITTTVTLTWAAGSDNAISYTIQQSPDNVNWSNTIATGIAGDQTSYLFPFIPTSTTNYYRIQAVNTIGASSWSTSFKLP